MASFQVALIAAVAVLLTLFASTSVGKINKADKEDELIDLIDQLRERVSHNKEKEKTSKKKNFLSRHDDYTEVRYRLDSYYREQKKKIHSRQDDLSPETIKSYEDAVNNLRRSVKAVDMNLVKWNSKLADLAQEWADRCESSHGHPPFEGAVFGFYEVGQNNWVFASDTGTFDPYAVLDDWMSEKKYYDEDTSNCVGGGCTRYKQLVWANTTDFGCGLASCYITAGIPKANLVVCYFGPAGNYHNERAYTPAKSGDSPCTKCGSGRFYCNRGLCDNTCTAESSTCECKADCRHCGAKTDHCTCKCNPGSVGVDCSSLCSDLSENCHKEWTPQLCRVALISSQCPKMCKKCTSVDPCDGASSPDSGSAPGPDGQPAPAPVEPEVPDIPSPDTVPDDPSDIPIPDTEPGAIEPSQNLDKGLTAEQKQRFVYLFNKHRREAGAANMNMVVWDEQLARVAQEWADKCVFKHRDLNNPGGDGYVSPASVGFPTSTIGENIAAYSDNSYVIPDKPVKDWFEEKEFYNFDSKTCQSGKDCGHYIAMLWAPTRAIGCGFTKCASVQVGGNTWSGGVMISCNMAPGADPAKQLFQVGPPCTNCLSGRLYCTNDLCDTTCATVGSGKCECKITCSAHGKKDDDDCSCACKDGYMGGLCNDQCQDLDPLCGSDWNFPDMFCNSEVLAQFGAQYAAMYETIKNSCPKLCGECVDSKKREGVKRIGSSSSSHSSSNLKGKSSRHRSSSRHRDD